MNKKNFKIEEVEPAGYKVEFEGEQYYVGAYSTLHGPLGNFGTIYKDEKSFEVKEGVCYIPEYRFPFDKPLGEEEEKLYQFAARSPRATAIKSNNYIAREGYTYNDFMLLCGSEELARDLFNEVDWQFPETLWDEWLDEDDEEGGFWIEAHQAYENIYLRDYPKTHDVGMEPVCFDEFFDNEWQNENLRTEYIKELQLMGYAADITVD